jgi:hypothetical protein
LLADECRRHLGVDGNAPDLPVERDSQWSFLTADAPVEEVFFAFPFLVGDAGGGGNLSRGEPHVLVRFGTFHLIADGQIGPRQAADGLRLERAEVEDPFLEPIRVGRRLRIKLRQPAAAKADVHVHGHGLQYARRRIEVDHRCFQPHGHKRVMARRGLLPVFPVPAGQERLGEEERIEVVDELGHRLVVDVDAVEFFALFVLQRGERAPFVGQEAVAAAAGISGRQRGQAGGAGGQKRATGGTGNLHGKSPMGEEATPRRLFVRPLLNWLKMLISLGIMEIVV